MLQGIDEARFVAKVRLGEGCWEWLASRMSTGYGQFVCRVDGVKRPQLAHRVAWALHAGRWPLSSEFVCHRCDNRGCVRPDHLFIGDHAANMADMVRKGRWDLAGRRKPPSGDHHYQRLDPSSIRRGEQIARVLTESAVRRARVLRAEGMSLAEIAESLGCSKSQAYRVVRGESWMHVV